MPDSEKVIKELNDWIIYRCFLGSSINPTLVQDAIALLKSQPQIVRCKDCCKSEIRLKRSCTPYDDGGWQRYCPNIRGWVDDDWFCADGEPKDGGGE